MIYEELGPIAFVPDFTDSNIYYTVPNPSYGYVPQLISFSEFHEEIYRDDYRYLFYQLLQDHRLPLGKLRKYSYEQISVQDLQFRTIRYQKTSDTAFEFFPVIEVFFSVSTTAGKLSLSEWYSVPGKSEIQEALWMFQDVFVYDYRTAPESTMTDYLVPYIRNYDEEAERMLSLYQPEALKKPCPIDVESLARAMGYQVKHVRLSRDFSIQGKVIFCDATVPIYRENGNCESAEIPAGTILIDQTACEKRHSSGRDAIVHECIHIFEHQLFFELQHDYQGFLQQCPDLSLEDYFLNSEELDCVRQMEQQATRMTPRVLMPASATKQKISELLSKFRPIGSFLQMEKTIKALAAFYDVSLEMAKRRMVELGYTEAKGVMTYVDGHYIPSYLADGNIRYNQSYTISLPKLMEEADRNPNFEKLILSGKWMYLEGHICKRDSKYIWHRDGTAMLSPYARNHMQECCLLFTIRHSTSDYQFIPGTLNKEVCTAQTDYLHSCGFYQNLRQEEEESKQEEKSVPDNFVEAFLYYKEKRKFSYLEIAMESHIEKSRLERITKTDLQKRKPVTYYESVLLALTLCTTPDLAIDFIEKSGFQTSKTAEQRFISRLIYMLFGAGVEEFNYAMMSAGYPLFYAEESMQAL